MSTTGTCSAPCNLIAGNTGAGVAISVTSTADSHTLGTITGNDFGVGAAGPLANGGGDITVSGSASSPGLLIGGDSRTGNLLATAAAPAIGIEGSTGSYPTVSASGNHFLLEGAGPPIGRPSGTVNPPGLAVTPAGSGVTVTGSTNHQADPSKAPETVEVYTADSCNPSQLIPIATTTASLITGDFALDLPAAALAGRTSVFALRTDQDGNTSAFSTCAQPAGTLGITQNNPTAGSTTTVSGTGFTPGEPVTVTLHSTPVLLTTVTADSTGAATATISIPADTVPGAHDLILTGTRSGHTISYPITVLTAPRRGLLHILTPRTLLAQTSTGRHKIPVAGHAGIPRHGAAAAAVLITTTAPISIDGRRITRSGLLTIPVTPLTLTATRRSAVRIIVLGYYLSAAGTAGDAWHRTHPTALKTSKQLAKYRGPSGADAILIQVNTSKQATSVNGLGLPAQPGSQYLLIRPTRGRIVTHLLKGERITVVGYLAPLTTATDGTTKQPSSHRIDPLRTELN